MPTISRTPYEQACEELGNVLGQERTSTDDLTLEEIWGDTITIYTERVYNINDLVDYLPVIIIDVASAVIEYPEHDQGYGRAIPLILALYLPLDTEDLSREEQAEAEKFVDLKRKQLYTGIEEIVQVAAGKSGVMNSLRLDSGSMPYESSVIGDSSTGRDAKIAIMHLTASSLIAG